MMNDTLFNINDLSGRQLDLLRLVFVASDDSDPDPYCKRDPVPLSLLAASGFTLEDIQGCAFLEEDNGAYLLSKDAEVLQLSNIDIQSAHCQKMITYLNDFDYYSALNGKFSYYECLELTNAINVIAFFKCKKNDNFYKLCEKMGGILETLGDKTVSLVYRAMWKYERDRGIIDVNKRIRQYCEAGGLYMPLARKLMNDDVEFKTKVYFLLAEIKHSLNTYSMGEKALALAKLYDILNDPLMKEHNDEMVKCATQVVHLSEHITSYSDRIKAVLPDKISKIQSTPERLNAAIAAESFKERNTDADWRVLLENLKSYIDDGSKYGLAFNIYSLIESSSVANSHSTAQIQFYEGLITYLETKKDIYNSQDLDCFLLESNRYLARILVDSGQCGDVLVNTCAHFYNTDYLFPRPQKYLRLLYEILEDAEKLSKTKNDYPVLLSLLLIKYRLFLKHGFMPTKRGVQNDIVDKLKHAFYQSGHSDDFDNWLTARLLDGGLK